MQDDPASKAETNTELGEDPDPDDDQQVEAEEGQHDAQMEEPDREDDEEMLDDGNDEQGGTEPAEHDSRCASEQGAQMEDPDRENDAEILDDGNGEQDGTEPSCEAGAGSKGAHSPDPGQRHHVFDVSEEGVEDDANEHADEDGGDGDDTNLCSEKEVTPAAQSHAKVDLSEEPEDSRQEEEEEYDEDPYLGEEPPEVQEDSDVEIEEHRDHEQDDPHPGAADRDSRCDNAATLSHSDILKLVKSSQRPWGAMLVWRRPLCSYHTAVCCKQAPGWRSTQEPRGRSGSCYM